MSLLLLFFFALVEKGVSTKIPFIIAPRTLVCLFCLFVFLFINSHVQLCVKNASVCLVRKDDFAKFELLKLNKLGLIDLQNLDCLL